MRIVINLDVVSNDGRDFARALGAQLREDNAGAKEVVVVKGGTVYRAYP